MFIAGSDADGQDISALNEDCHVHGRLEIRIGNRAVPYLGYFGPDDVCFSDWINELDGVLEEFDGKTTATYLFDEGEQGQPAFLFERDHEQVFLSIVDSEISGGMRDREWQRVAFSFQDFAEQVKAFKAGFIKELRAAAPNAYTQWLNSFVSYS